MKPIKFKHHNTILAENQTEYTPLPVLKLHTGEIISCWKLSFWERLRVLFTGNVWLNVQSFGNPIHPVNLSTKRKDMFVIEIEKYQGKI